MSGDQKDRREPEKQEGRAGVRELLRPRLSRGQLAGGLLCLLLGFAVVAQVETTKRDTTFAAARQDELVGVLSDLSQRSERLRGDLRELEDTRARLERDGEGTTALADARERAAAYGLLAGTLPAEGPGIEVTVEDPAGRVRAVHLLDALQELRDAGAEVVQINDVRAGTGTYFVDAAGGVVADGRFLRAPYRFLVIGDAHTMTTALDIPGGVTKTLEGAGARVAVEARPKIEIRVTRPG
ncbi:DUF881 domain-containing protein [Actinomadura sp. 21ATH]|uniref:DUF881 domain-containing protein n=1 Tax=Actinomadura sp. 21ATH TaxID=1735444 RepID=UPI0035C08299